MFKYIEQEGFHDEYHEDEDKYIDLQRSMVHKIVVRPALTQYIDLVHWTLKHYNVENHTNLNGKREVI